MSYFPIACNELNNLLLSISGKRARKQAVEAIQNNIKWLDQHKATIQNWFEQNIK